MRVSLAYPDGTTGAHHGALVFDNYDNYFHPSSRGITSYPQSSDDISAAKHTPAHNRFRSVTSRAFTSRGRERSRARARYKRSTTTTDSRTQQRSIPVIISGRLSETTPRTRRFRTSLPSTARTPCVRGVRTLSAAHQRHDVFSSERQIRKISPPALTGTPGDRATSDAKHPHASRRLEGWTRVGGSRGRIVRMRHKQTVKKNPIYRVGDAVSDVCYIPAYKYTRNFRVDDIMIHSGVVLQLKTAPRT